MDVYTNPQSTTYLLWKPFWCPTESGDFRAISIPNHFVPTLGAMYALLTIYLFNAIWNVLLYSIMLTAPLRNGLAWNLILAVYWNSAEPLAACSNLMIHVARMLRKGFESKDGSVRLGLSLTAMSLIFAISGILGGILIPPMMILGNVAPVNPEAVWLPIVPELGAMSSRFSMLYSTAAVRALGSAEASKVTLRDKVSVYQENTGQSTDENPDFFIAYEYNITGVELGLCHNLGLVHSVQGKCWTEYGWLHQSNSTPELDFYDPWNLSEYPLPVESKSGLPISSKLDLAVAIHPQHVESTPANVSYALVYLTAHLPSDTESNDVMYITEIMPEVEGWNQSIAFRVKAERPALSCWQTSTICVHSKCGSPYDLISEVPPGLSMILSQLGMPMVLSIASRMGPSALMSFYSPLPGRSVDAASSSTFADLERLVLGSYLLTRNLFRDTTMMESFSGFQNGMLDDKGRYLNGAGDFVLESGSVTALSLPALITLPLLTLFMFLLGMVLNAFAHSDADSQFQRPKCERLVNLATPHLYRVANSTRDVNPPPWKYQHRLHPIPTSEKDELRVPLLSSKNDEV